MNRRWEGHWELSVLSGSDTAGERVSENWKCQFCPVQIPQVRESVRTGSVSSVWFRYHSWESQWELEVSVLSSSDTTGGRVSNSHTVGETVSENWKYLFCPVKIPQVRKSLRTETIHSVLFSSDTTSVSLRKKWNSPFHPVQIPQVRVSKNWNCPFCPVQIPQVRQSVRTGTIRFVQFRYWYRRWESQWELSVLCSLDTADERVNKNELFCGV